MFTNIVDIKSFLQRNIIVGLSYSYLIVVEFLTFSDSNPTFSSSTGHFTQVGSQPVHVAVTGLFRLIRLYGNPLLPLLVQSPPAIFWATEPDIWSVDMILRATI